jgi:hypothetical protein
MDSIQINRMILDKVEEKQLPPHVKGFVQEILQHEQGGLDQDMPRYSRAYEVLINKYIREKNNTEKSNS